MHTCPLCHHEADSAFEMLRHLNETRRYGSNQTHSYTVPENFLRAVSDEKYSSGFPNTSGHFDVGGLDVEIKPRVASGGRKTAAHRIFVTCPTCSKKIPVGRLHQHLVVHGGRSKVCSICGKGYGTSEHLRTHIRVTHGAHSPLRPNEYRAARGRRPERWG